MRTQADRDQDLALGRELERKDAEIERLRLLLAERDDFIVERGLWSDFVTELGEHECHAASQQSHGLPPIDESFHTPELIASLQERALAPQSQERAEGHNQQQVTQET